MPGSNVLRAPVTQPAGPGGITSTAALPLPGLAAGRHELEVAARRLPVLLLFPLVLCVLPAFVLLTVVPLLASSLHDLQV